MSRLINHCYIIEELFKDITNAYGRTQKELILKHFKSTNAIHEDLIEDVDFCFEVLAGWHKLGYTFSIVLKPLIDNNESHSIYNYTIKMFYNYILKCKNTTNEEICVAGNMTPSAICEFIEKLVNRKYRLGYSNKSQMLTSYSPMLAKKYQDIFKEKFYYIQEKLDGNRCIAHYDEQEKIWKFTARSGKDLKVNFDMSWAPTELIFDGEIMTLAHAGSRDFNRTSGAINGKYTDKSGLHYFIYDIIEQDLTYEKRKEILDRYEGYSGKDCQILPVLDKVWVWPNHDYNYSVDKWLDYITDKGGEGIMLRDPDGLYECGKRSNALLKYKKVQTMDLRIIDFNYGNGKYEGAIGSFYCESDDRSIRVNVSGMPDEIHFGNPADYMGRIIEVAYFDISAGKNNDYKSLRFPRLKQFRDDKNETSIY